MLALGVTGCVSRIRGPSPIATITVCFAEGSRATSIVVLVASHGPSQPPSVDLTLSILPRTVATTAITPPNDTSQYFMRSRTGGMAKRTEDGRTTRDIPGPIG